MTAASADPGSFRDPGSRVFIDGQRVLRAIYKRSANDYAAARDKGVLDYFISKGWLVESQEVDVASHAAGVGADHLLEHPKLPFVSYPYEWPFALHRKAALLQLDVMLEALERDFTLSDATAYNIQFLGSEPKFIDHLSLRPYVNGELWSWHRQFCMQFLNPIIMWSRLGLAPNSWFRGSLEGIAPEDLSRLLRWRDNLSLTILSHVTAQGAAQRRATETDGANVAKTGKLSKTSFKAMLLGLRDFIAKASVPTEKTVWDTYDKVNSYQTDEADKKRRFVMRMVEGCKPKLLYDLGCNTGDYSAAALEAGAEYVIGFDFDHGALERAVKRSSDGNLPYLPLWLDATNPSPAQGWNQQERRGFSDRARGDAVIALAFIHHLAIARNIPLESVVDWIMAVAPVGIIEFPPKSDPMVQRLLSRREDIFPNYTGDRFIAEIQKRGRIVEREQLSPGGRLMVWYDRS